MQSTYNDIAAYITKDGSEIRELLHPNVHGNKAQSLAEAIVPPGAKTLLHRHHRTEEIYHFTAGEGLMTLNEDTFAVRAGDTVAIAPGNAHCVENTGKDPMKILCACAPAYSHEDTELL